MIIYFSKVLFPAGWLDIQQEANYRERTWNIKAFLSPTLKCSILKEGTIKYLEISKSYC